MNKRGDGWYCYFKTDNIEELLGTPEMYVGATKCPYLKVDYKKEKNEFSKKRPLSDRTDSKHKRLKAYIN